MQGVGAGCKNQQASMSLRPSQPSCQETGIRIQLGAFGFGCKLWDSGFRISGYHAAVCVHVDTQSGCFGGDVADFALQTRVECRVAEAELVLVRLRWRNHRRSKPRSPDEPVGREDEGICRTC